LITLEEDEERKKKEDLIEETIETIKTHLDSLE
jgi:hypothetical protein